MDILVGSEIDEFLAVVSNELLHTNKETDVSLVLKLLPSDLWLKLDKMSRLRVENMLAESMENAWYFPEKQKTNNAPATWASNIIKHFLRKKKLRALLIKKLKNEDFDQHNFIGQYYMYTLKYIFIEIKDIQVCVNAISNCLERGNEFMKDSLLSFLSLDPPLEWQDAFTERLISLTDQDSPEKYLSDGTPILGKFEAKLNPAGAAAEEDEIPF